MFKRITKKQGSPALSKLAALAIAAALGCGGASAQPSGATPVTVQFASVDLSDLETAFWVCEYAATIRGNANIDHCTVVYAALKSRKFGGDFDSLVQWWQQNREAMFSRLARELAPARGR